MPLQGAVRPNEPRNRSQAYRGAPSPAQTSQRVQPLPPPLGVPPYHYSLDSVIGDASRMAAQRGRLVFHVVGDTGGIQQPQFQRAVAAAMAQDLARPEAERPLFFYHLGDVVYYSGERAHYYEQFYLPYRTYSAPIFAIPGNHDGDAVDPGRSSLDGWVLHFMTATPRVDEISGDAPRPTMCQPNVYFTLVCPLATIVGLYSNVPEYGCVDALQHEWLTHELKTAPSDKALLICMHQPVYSFDNCHGGSPRMAQVLEKAINDTRRLPNLVLTGHVHNYQRIERDLIQNGPTPFIVAGHGGYPYLHDLNAAKGARDWDTGARLVAGNDKRHGYVTLSITVDRIHGAMTLVSHDNSARVEPRADQFEYTARPLWLPDGVHVSL